MLKTLIKHIEKYKYYAISIIASGIPIWQYMSYYSVITDSALFQPFTSISIPSVLPSYSFYPVRDLNPSSDPKGFYKFVGTRQLSSMYSIKSELYIGVPKEAKAQNLFPNLKTTGDINIDWAVGSSWINVTLDRDGRVVYSIEPLLLKSVEGRVCMQSLDYKGYYKRHIPALNNQDRLSGNFKIHSCPNKKNRV